MVPLRPALVSKQISRIHRISLQRSNPPPSPFRLHEHLQSVGLPLLEVEHFFVPEAAAEARLEIHAFTGELRIPEKGTGFPDQAVDIKQQEANINALKDMPPRKPYDLVWYTKTNAEKNAAPGVKRDRRVVLNVTVKSLKLPPAVEAELIALAKVKTAPSCLLPSFLISLYLSLPLTLWTGPL